MVLAGLVDRLIAYMRYYISKVVTSSSGVVRAALCSHVHAHAAARERARRMRTIPVDDVPDGKQLSSHPDESRSRVCAWVLKVLSENALRAA